VNLLLLEADEARNEVTLDGVRGRHLLHVLHVEPGQQVRVGVVDGPRGTATVESITGEMVTLRCAFEADAPPVPAVDLLLALPRPKVMRRLWAQIAAMGVGRIILTNAERVERNYFDTHVLTPECYRPLLVEGLQQARDTRLPCVSIHRQFKVLVEDELDRLFPTGLRLVADPAAVLPAASVARERVGERVLLAVGPEGGWNAFETSLLDAHGFTPVSMGPRTLRTDTACIALLALVHSSSAHL
jgi:16S rRNA (uracil1498-N3)-methyltransferase